MFGLGKDFTDGTKRINIDYKRIEEYKTPFVMTLEVEGKNKLDVWKVLNGKKAKEIRERYKELNRRTSYVDFYKTIDDLISEKGKEGFEFNPRICGTKNRKGNKLANAYAKKMINQLEIFNQETSEIILPKKIDEITLDDLYGVDMQELKYLFAKKINEIIKEINQ